MTQVRHKFADVVLGFIEPFSDESLNAAPFVSKAGGKPEWLYRGDCKPPAPPRCSVCLQPQKFLVQVYAPVEPEVVSHDEAFHRMLYVAVCPSQGCHRDSKCVSVIRAQLPRANKYYSYDGNQDGNALDETASASKDVCVLCGFGGAKQCGDCHTVSYCSRICQAADWKLGHRDVCVGNDSSDKAHLKAGRERWRFPEYEIVTDCHPTPPDSECDSDGEIMSDNEALENEQAVQSSSVGTSNVKDSHKCTDLHSRENTCGPSESNRSASVINAEVQGTFQDADEDELPEDLFKTQESDKRDPAFTRFSQIVSYASDQVIRYEWNGSPLWAMTKSRYVDPGTCELCGAERIFEMQVMPQLAYFLSKTQSDAGTANMTIEQIAQRLRNDAEWGTICVFSCSRSCSLNDGEYAKEFAWMQRLQ